MSNLFWCKEKSTSLFSNFTLNLYLIYELNNCLHNPSINFTLIIYWFDALKLMRNLIKKRFSYNGQGIAFDWVVAWSLCKWFSRNVVIFGANNTLSQHTNNQQNIILVLGEGSNNDFNVSVGKAVRKISVNFPRAYKHFYLSLHYTGGESYLYVNKTKVCKFMVCDNIIWFEFFWGKRTNFFRKRWTEWNFFQWNCYWFLSWL